MALLEQTRQELERADCVHTPCYCEENVYLLIKRLADAELAAADSSDLFVIFVSNEGKQVVMWRQRAGTGSNGLCIWDYHVFLVQKRNLSEGGSLVWDLDTTLPFPVAFETYYEEAFRPDIILDKAFERLFRVVPASSYLQHFSSDRSHMRLSDGSWMAPPPPYDPIVQEGVAHTFGRYISVTIAGKEADSDDPKAAEPYDAAKVAADVRFFGHILAETAFSCHFLGWHDRFQILPI